MGCGASSDLPGGFKADDVVVSLIMFEDEFGKIAVGNVGTIVGPCSQRSLADKAARLNCDFPTKRKNIDMLATQVMLAEEHWRLQSALHGAARKGDVEEIGRLIEAGAVVDLPARFSHPALHEAASKGHTSAIQRLLEAGAKLDAFDTSRKTALHYAAQYDQECVVQQLLEAGIPVDATDYYQRTPLHCAVSGGSTSAFQRLLEAGANVNAAHDSVNHGYHREGNTALHDTGLTGNIAMTRLLLEAKAAVNMENEQGKTPLKVAVESGQDAVAELLRKAGGTL